MSQPSISAWRVSCGWRCFGNAATDLITQPASLIRTAGQSASFSVMATGANLSYQWRRNSTNIPGATASSYTISSVVPADAAQYDVIVNVACGNATSTAATLTVNCQTITVTPVSLGSASTGAAFSQTFTQAGGIGAITWNLAGTTPPGLSFNAATATLSGTPTQGGSYSFTIRATDTNGCFGERHYTLGVDCALVTVNPTNANLPGGTAGAPYSQSFTAAGGASPHSFAISAGDLPEGLTLNSGGSLSGKPIAYGPFAVKLGADGKFKVYTFATTHLVVDILGYYSEEAVDANGVGLLFNLLPSPVRLLETRPDFPGFPLAG